MLEILLLRSLYRSLSGTAVAKGRSGSWGMLGVLFWIGGEVLGFVLGALMDLGMGAYLIALVFAGLGAGVALLIVRSLGSELAEPAYDPVGGIGQFDPNNPYSPPGTRPRQ